jgi:lysophospholipase L1-like esterase
MSVSRFFSPYTGTNDRGIGVEPTFFAQTMCAFVARLADIYHETLQHICILVRLFHTLFPLYPTGHQCLLLQHPFPCFGVTEEQPAFAHAISKVVDQVTEDRPRLGLHVWDLGGSVLNEDLTIDQLHPTLQGHILLGEALARLLRPLIGGA